MITEDGGSEKANMCGKGGFRKYEDVVENVEYEYGDEIEVTKIITIWLRDMDN